MGMKWGVRKYKDKNAFGPRFNKKYNKLLSKISESNKNKDEKTIVKYQRKAAKMASRKLNKYDKKISLYQAEKSNLLDDKKRYEKALKKHTKKNQIDKIKRDKEGIRGADIAIKSYENRIKNGAKITEKLLKNAKYNGISINKMATLRSVKTKRDWGITLVSAAFASNPYGGVAIDSYTSTIGTKYKAAKKPK